MTDVYDPAAGSVGYLTFDEFDRFRRADDNARRYVPWLRVAGYLRAGTDPDEFRSRSVMSHPPLGLPATWLAAEEITRLSYEINCWPTHEAVARDIDGSELALLFTREVETAVAKWPIADRPRSVKFFRCTSCNQATLRYYPPTLADEVVRDSAVKCTDKSCRAVIDEAMFARMALLIEQEWELRNGKRRVDPLVGGPGEGGPVSENGPSVAAGWQGADDASDESPLALRSRSVGRSA